MVHAACAYVYVKQGDMLTISFQGRKVFLPLKSVVAGGVKEDGGGGGGAVEIHVLTEILQDLNYEDPPIILNIIVPSTHVDDLWSLGCIIYQSLFGSPLCSFDCQQINSLLIPLLCSFYAFSLRFLGHL